LIFTFKAICFYPKQTITHNEIDLNTKIINDIQVVCGQSKTRNGHRGKTSSSLGAASETATHGLVKALRVFG